MSSALEITHKARRSDQKLVPPAPFVAVIAATSAVIFGLAASLSWQGDLIVALGAAALAVGAVFTVLEIQRLGKAARFVR